MNAASPADFEIIDFIVGGTTPEAVAHFQPSVEAQQRVVELIEGEKEQFYRRNPRRPSPRGPLP